MKSDLYAAINQIASERGLTQEEVVEALRAALKAAYRRLAGGTSTENVRIDIDPISGEIKVYAERLVVLDPNAEGKDKRSLFISLEEARKIKPDAQLGELLVVEITPKDFGRVAAQTVKQVITQKIRDAERARMYRRFRDRVGEVVTARVLRYNRRNVYVEIEGAEAILPPKEQIPGEFYKPGQRLKVYILEVPDPEKGGGMIVVSRSHPGLIRRLFELEVPEVQEGTVEIKALAREPGGRTKVAVWSDRPNVDPVGCCVGRGGSRINAITQELGRERVDVIQWSPDPQTFIRNALSPADVAQVALEEKDGERRATVLVPKDQLSLAIGREGQNVRLAAKLTGWHIDIKSTEELARQLMGDWVGEELEARAAQEQERAAVAAEAEVGTEDPWLATLRKAQAEIGADEAFLQDLEALQLLSGGAASEKEAQAEAAAEAPWAGRKGETRKVRKDGTLAYKNRTYGPLPEELVGETVQVIPVEGTLYVVHGGKEVARFPLEEG